MKDFWKKHKSKVIAAVAIVAVLAVAFYIGGNAPGLRGWTVGRVVEPGESTSTRAATATPATEDVTAESGGDRSSGIALSVEDRADEPEVSAEPDDGLPPEVLIDPSEVTTVAPTMEINPETGRDQYNTDPVPEGMPLPVEPQEAVLTGDTGYCTVSIACQTILDNLDWLDPEKVELVPEDGWILQPVTVSFSEGESVFDVLLRVCQQNSIHMEFKNTPLYNSAYIEGIANLYEFDCGNLSGWMYKVNDWFPNYGCSRYQVADGDVICWVYTCDLGYDVGGGYSTG